MKNATAQWGIIICFCIAMITSTIFVWAIGSWKWAMGWIAIQAFALAWSFTQVAKENS